MNQVMQPVMRMQRLMRKVRTLLVMSSPGERGDGGYILGSPSGEQFCRRPLLAVHFLGCIRVPKYLPQ